MKKPLGDLTRSEIERLYDRQSAAVSTNNQEIINAGFGHWRGSEIRAAAVLPQAHHLFTEYVRFNDALQDTIAELKFRERYHGTHHRVRRKA